MRLTSVRRQLVVFIALLALAATSPLAAEPRWTMIPGRSMTVIGDQSAETLRDVATQIEQFRAVVGGLIPNANRPLPLPTVVVVFGTRKSMELFVPVKNGKPASLDGLFVRWPDANHIVLTLEDFDESAAVIYHEYTHLLLANAVRTLPAWLNEGLAEYYGSYRLAADRRSAIIGRPLPWRVQVLRQRYMPLRELIATDASAVLHDEGTHQSIFYAEAWALTHYLLTEFPNGAAAINNFAAAVASGTDAADAFTQAFGASPDEFDKQLTNYIRRPGVVASRFTFTDRLTVEAPGAPRAISANEANAWLGDLQRRVHRTDEGAQRIEAAVAKEPDIAICQVALGLLRLSQERTEEGIAALSKADALAREDFMTQFVRGVALLRADRRDSENVAAAARALERAAAINPDSSEAHAWLAYAQMQSENTLAQARASIERAIELAPGRLDYRLRYADVRILQGQPGDVRALLTAIATNRNDPIAAEHARSRINAILAAAQRAGDQPSEETADRPPGASASVSTPGTDAGSPVPEPTVQLQLRHVQEGEQRAYGELTRLECAAGSFRFHVRIDGAEMVASARRMEDVDLIQYLDIKDFTLACGPHTPPAPVLLTWRQDTVASARASIAVALEFVPKNYVP